MAGIEKICEFSNEYPGWLMYGYKRNQFQIIPKYRKLFRKDGDTLYVQVEGKRWKYPWGDASRSYEASEMTNYDPPFTSEKEFIQYITTVDKLRLITEYHFAYLTSNNNLAGTVGGVYQNWTTDLPATKRKIKRLLRCKKLNIIFVEDLSATIKEFKSKKTLKKLK